MAKQVINTGTVPDDGTGDNLRNAFVKVNSNFTELYDYNANTDNQAGIGLDDISVTVAGSPNGNGNLAYNNGTGVFTFTPADVPAELTDLGISDGSANQVLTTDGDGAFSFANVTGLKARGELAGTTSSLADDGSANLDITGHKGYALLAIEVDRAAWVRVYTHSAARSADASRAQTEDPASDAGVIAEVITTGASTVQIAPGAIGYSFEGTPSTTIPCRVTNLSGAASTVEVTLTAIQLEA